MQHAILDEAPINPIARMRLMAELMGLVRQKNAIAPAEPMAAFKGARVASQIVALLGKLGVDLRAKPVEPTPPPAEPVVPAQPRNPSAQFYAFNEDRKPAQRKRDNIAAMALLARIDSGEQDGATLTDAQKEVLAKYSGTGGALIGADGKKGSAYEYYTPKPIAEGMWSLMRELGFSGGKVLDPSAGNGIFGGTAPINAVVDAVELNETSGRINALINQGPGYSVEVSPYEKVASATPDEIYDAVITNVPFGELADRGGNELGDKRYQKQPLQNYFILRSLEKLKPGGLAAFITPPRCVTGKGGKEEQLRIDASFMAEFLGAYRLPNSVFGSASADTMTDVIVFRKYSREVAAKIEELREQNPEWLVKANVLWPEFVGGKYFTGEGIRFVLGTMARAKGQFGEKDVLNTDLSIADIAKLLRKFPGSRVNWELLSAAETQPIIYAEGDTVTQKGQTLQLKDGAWVVLESNEASPDMLAVGGQMASPLQAFRNGVTWVQAVNYMQFMIDTSQALDIPDWARGAFNQLKRLPTEGDRARYWNAGVVGMSVAFLLSEHQTDGGGFDYLTTYADVSTAMMRVAIDAKNSPGSVGGDIKSGMKAIAVHYSKKAGYSGVWRGSFAEDLLDDRTADQKFEGVKYAQQGVWVDRESAAEILGDGVDPIADADWCLSDDGAKLAKADDYFVGNYADMIARINAAALAATDPVVKGKLLAQLAEAERRVDRVDVTTVSFNLFSPYATLEEKTEFLRRFVSPHFAVAFDEKTGKPYIECTLKKIVSARDKLLKRIAQYLKNGTVTLGGAEVGDVKQGMSELRGMITTANEQFNGWCKANPVIMARLNEVANDPARLYFRQVEDESPLVIPGLSGNVTPHGYQNSYIRRMGRSFGGINGFDVGLGKTLTALAAAQYVQSIGVKKKTAFIVPNSVLSNWRKEAKNVYDTMDDCLFVGLDTNVKTGKSKVDSANYDRDLNIVLENRHKKIFMTMEAFQRLRLRDETIEAYEKFMRSVDVSFAESEDKKADEAAKGKAKRLMALLTDGKSGSTPYLEDMGIDSIVMDEAHCFPAGTMVGGIPIESIKVGDLVDSFNHGTGLIERRPVTDVMQRPVLGLVRVHLKNDKSIVCTHDHPFYVHGLGYVAAEFLNNGYDVYSNYSKTEKKHEVHALSGGIPALEITALLGKEGRQRVLLDGVLCGSQAQEAAYIQGLHPVREELRVKPCAELESSFWHGEPVLLREVVRDDVEAPALGCAEIGIEQRSEERDASRSTTFVQLASNAGGGGKEPSSSIDAGIEQGPKDSQPWRQRGGNDCPAGVAGQRASVVGGACRGDELPTGAGEAVFLQAGHSAPTAEDSDRGGRALSQVVEGQGVGPEEGFVPEIVGVDRVEVLESRGDRRFGGVCPDGLVYDITVDGNHNFFAEGILVHNCFKNSASTVEFKSAKFLALAPSASRGIDAQAKAWYIRSKSPLKDGVLLLSATPITNSPLEVYSMLSLAVGRDRVNDMAMGIKGADQFMDVMCRVESEEDETVDGIVRDTRIFKGLENVAVLRKALGDIAVIKDSKSVGQQVKVPDADEVSSAVALPEPPILATLMEYKGAFRYAIDTISERADNRGDQAAYERVAAKFGEPMELIGHPFNLISKMTMLIIDPELDERATFYVTSKGQKDKAEAVIKTFNAKKYTEERARPGPHSAADAVVGQITRKDGEDKIVLLKIQVAAKLDGERIIIDTISPEAQSAFEAMAEKEGLELDVTVPPKLAAMLANVIKEETNPRGIDSEGNHTPRVKQLIFCDILPLHNKIKRLLAKRAGIPSSAIAIITGKQNNTPDEIMAVQDGFNADGEDNKYRIVIANEKAEVGINLQRGTQAIHHLTIGWTPDSLTQRNGRGVRQGNKTERVTVYTYDANGTFDSHKRAMVSKKAGWIDQVMDVNGGDSINVEGGMSREQLEALIDTVGDADAMTRLQERLATKEREVRAVGIRAKQTVNIRTVESNLKFLAQNPDAKSWAARKFGQYYALKQQAQSVEGRLGNIKISATALVKGQNLLADLNARLGGLKASLEEALTITKSDGTASTVDALLEGAMNGYLSRGDDRKDKVEEAVKRGLYNYVVTANDNSAIANEWQSEIDMTKAMIKEAKSAFTKQSKQDGGMPAEVMAAFAEGKGVILDGKPIVDGTFIKTEGGNLAVVTDSGQNVQAWRADGWSATQRLANLRPPYAIILPGSAEYDAAVTEAAALEDGFSASGVAIPESDAVSLFSALVPAVSQRRTTTSLMLCDVDSTGLPAPYFPKVLDPESASMGAVFARIIADQAGIIKAYNKGRYNSGHTFTVDSTVPIIKIRSRYTGNGYLPEALAFARSNGLKMTLLEVEEFVDSKALIRKAAGYPVTQSLESVLTGSTETELNAAADEWVSALMADIDLGGNDALGFLAWDEQRTLQAAIKRALTPPQVPVTQAIINAAIAAVNEAKSDAVPVVLSGDIGDDDLVGIKGNTKEWKNSIKAAAVNTGGRAIWDGDNVQWNVQYKARIYITKTSPAATKPGQLEMVEFSGKARYGKRK